MAATISVNFATVEEVFSTDILNPPPSKKSVSAKVLADALGGGVVGGGYVRRTGDSMTGYLTLTSSTPSEPYHAASKTYVDQHAYTRRYYYECKNEGYGNIPVGTTTVSGLDIYTNNMVFFNGDDTSNYEIWKYMDVYRDGILQMYGQDYNIVTRPGYTFMPGATAIVFEEPFVSGSTVQVNIGNTGAYPVTFGLYTIENGFGLNFSAASGAVTAYVTPSSFEASSEQVSLSTADNVFVSPRSLSAYPLMPRAMGLFRSAPGYYPVEIEDPYGDINGNFTSFNNKKILSIKSKADGTSPNFFRATLEQGFLFDNFYNALITVNFDSASDFTEDNIVFATIIAESRELSAFNFYVYNVFGGPPSNVKEISIQLY